MNSEPSDNAAASQTYGFKDVFASLRVLVKKPLFWMSIVALCLASWLVLTWVELRSARRELQANVAGRANVCSSAKLRAMNTVQATLDLAKDKPEADPIGALWAGQPIAIAMVACQADPLDNEAYAAADRLVILIKELMRNQQFDAVDQLIVRLNETPLGAWKDLELLARPTSE